jgi:hypothetical protein
VDYRAHCHTVEAPSGSAASRVCDPVTLASHERHAPTSAFPARESACWISVSAVSPQRQRWVPGESYPLETMNPVWKWPLVLAIGIAPIVAPGGTVQRVQGASQSASRAEGFHDQKSVAAAPAAGLVTGDVTHASPPPRAYTAYGRSVAQPRARIEWRLASLLLAGLYLLFAGLLRALFVRPSVRVRT